MRGDYAGSDMGTALSRWASRKKLFKILTVDSVMEWWNLVFSQLVEQEYLRGDGFENVWVWKLKLSN